MQQAGNLQGEALALESMARTLEYMGSISQACETLETVSQPLHFRPIVWCEMWCLTVDYSAEEATAGGGAD